MKTKVIIYVSAVLMLFLGIFLGYKVPNLVWVIALAEFTFGVGFSYYSAKLSKQAVDEEKDVEINSLKTSNALIKEELERKKAELASIKSANKAVKKEKKPKKVGE